MLYASKLLSTIKKTTLGTLQWEYGDPGSDISVNMDLIFRNCGLINTDRGPAALGLYWTTISQNSVRIYRYVLARVTILSQYSHFFHVYAIIMHIGNGMHLKKYRSYFQDKAKSIFAVCVAKCCQVSRLWTDTCWCILVKGHSVVSFADKLLQPMEICIGKIIKRIVNNNKQ